MSSPQTKNIFAMNDPVIGKEIEGYRVEEVLGRGGMGVVYKATEISLSRAVALKCLNPELAGDESFLSRFRSEARAIARVNSPYIVQIYTLSETEIGLVIVMEYVEGRTLKQRTTGGETDWTESLPLVQQMLTALHHAHDAGVVHRDIKPQNILLSDTALAHGIRVKMTDFGLAKINTSGDRSRTVTEGVYGTLHYMSPEQVEGHGEIDYRSDIYSLGMTCYEMLAGRLPFDEDSSEYKIMRTIVEEDLPELGTFAAGVPGELQNIIMKAVAKDPADRFQSAVEMQEALERFEEGGEQGYSDQNPETIPADLDSPAPDSPSPDSSSPDSPALEFLVKDTPVSTETAPAEDEERGAASAPSAQRSSSGGRLRRVAGVGAVLAAILVGVWYFAVGFRTPWSEPDAAAVVEQDAPEGKTSDGGAAGETQEENRTSTEERTTGEDTGGQARSAGADASEEKTADAGATGAEASDQGTADTNENQETSRPDLPSPIAALLDIDDPSVLSERVDELVKKGQLTRGDEPGDFFKPGQCYIFVVGSGSVEAVFGPETDGTRVELRSGENVEDWSSRYSKNRQIWVE